MRHGFPKHSKMVAVLFCVGLISVFILSCGGSSGGDDDGDTYTAGGSYVYDSGTGVLTLTITSSNFPNNCGPEVGIQASLVYAISETTMTWDEGDDATVWTRDSGTAGGIVGTWNLTDEFGNIYEIVLNADETMVVTGKIVYCADDGGDGGGTGTECAGEDLFGPEGGVIEVTDPDNEFYGMRIVVPAGALDACRSLYVDEGWVADLPSGGSAYPHWATQVRLGTGGEKPYDLELEFFFPVTGLVIHEGEAPCAFGYDSRAKKWNLILPDSFDSDTMRVHTTYHDYWTWGKINLNNVSSENLIGAMKKKYGEETWDSVISGIIEAIDVLETLYVDRTCPTWTRVRDVDLPSLIEARKDLLVSYQAQIGQCGICDLFSLDFGLDLSKFALAKTVILAADLWDIIFGDYAGYMPFLGTVDFFVSLERFIAISFIENQVCDYACVTKELGLSVYSTYAIHHVYLVTYYVVSEAIENDFWVACP